VADAAARAGDLRNYAVVTAAYWADTIADGAIRILVLFFFYQLGYSPFELATLFVFYEAFGIATNLAGGWIGARFGLRSTLLLGLVVQLGALGMLALAPDQWLVVGYVMAAQALSGIAKDLTKMSSKSAVKLVAPAGRDDALFRWVAVLTGSKNALKGVGFFVGGLLLSTVGFQAGLGVLAVLVGAGLVLVLAAMRGDLGRASRAAKFTRIFSNERAINMLAAWPGSSSSPRATSGSWSVCRSSCGRFSAGRSGRSEASSRSGSSVTESSRPLPRDSSNGEPSRAARNPMVGQPPGWHSCSLLFPPG